LAGYERNLSKPEVRLIYGAPVLVPVFATPYAVEDYDYALAAENMMRAAHSLGIGSCWIGVAIYLGWNEGFLKDIGVSEGHKLIAPLIFGYPAKGDRKTPPHNTDVILKWMS
jgi:nitroreductase